MLASTVQEWPDRGVYIQVTASGAVAACALHHIKRGWRIHPSQNGPVRGSDCAMWRAAPAEAGRPTVEMQLGEQTRHAYGPRETRSTNNACRTCLADNGTARNEWNLQPEHRRAKHSSGHPDSPGALEASLRRCALWRDVQALIQVNAPSHVRVAAGLGV
jgi:hypothetical protein